MSTPSSNEPTSSLTTRPTALERLTKALQPLTSLGLFPANQPKELPAVATLLASVADQPELRDQALVVGRVLSQTTVFNEVVRDQVKEMHTATRYEEINKLFASIRDDARKLVDQLADGKIDTREKISNFVNNLFKGSIHDRFEKIRKLYNEVTSDTAKQLERERTILNAYSEFRLSLKEAELVARDLLSAQETQLANANSTLKSAAGRVETETDARAKGEAQIVRDEAKIHHDAIDRNYQVVKSVSENLTVSYNVGETVMAKLAQAHGVKEAVYNQAVTFFVTNESVFTALDAAFTSTVGLHEGTQTIESMKAGANQSLDVLAEVTGAVQKDALKSAYGSTISVDSVKRLVDSIVRYESESQSLIAQYRQEATDGARQIEQVVEDGKKQLAAIPSV
jgi:hypothetical protein